MSRAFNDVSFKSRTSYPPPSQLSCRHFGEVHDALSDSTRQSQLIVVAEKLLQEYYTRFSQEPSSLSNLYLDNAEVIYTGKELNVDAVLLTGKDEIHAFFQSEQAARFKGSRVMVDALHPLSSPLSTFAVVMFAKGRMWLPDLQSADGFAVSAFYHFLCMAPQPKASWASPPQYLVANEYLHVSDVTLSQQHFPVSFFASQLSAPVSNTMDLPFQAPVFQAPPSSPTDSSQPRRFEPVATRKQECSLHAQADGPLNPEWRDSELRDAITIAMQRSVSGCGSGNCTDLSRPRFAAAGGGERTFFFIHLDSPQTTTNLRLHKHLELASGVTLTLSPVRPKPVFRRYNSSNSLIQTHNKSAEITHSSQTTETATHHQDADSNPRPARMTDMTNPRPDQPRPYYGRPRGGGQFSRGRGSVNYRRTSGPPGVRPPSESKGEAPPPGMRSMDDSGRTTAIV